jgi:hypothetical protein
MGESSRACMTGTSTAMAQYTVLRSIRRHRHGSPRDAGVATTNPTAQSHRALTAPSLCHLGAIVSVSIVRPTNFSKPSFRGRLACFHAVGRNGPHTGTQCWRTAGAEGGCKTNSKQSPESVGGSTYLYSRRSQRIATSRQQVCQNSKTSFGC